MTSPIRLTVVMTHPVQYYSPWFRHIVGHCPSISLTVVYAILPTPTQQGTGFEATFQWDTSLTDGYRMRVVREPKERDRLESGRFFGLNAAEIGHAVLATDPDVVLVPGWNSATLVRAALACRRHGIPVVYRGDSQLGTTRNFAAAALRGKKTRAMLRLFSHYLAVGQRSFEYLKHFGAPEDLTFFSPHCVDNQFFALSAEPYHEPDTRRTARIQLGIPTDDFVVLYVGKLEEKKRPLDAIAASAALGNSVTLLIVGSGKAEVECREAARGYGVNCVFSGFMNQSALGLPYGIADCLALPSDHRETWGLVVNEAMATGLPCVVSSAAGCAPDLVLDGQTGYTYPLADVSSLSAALDSVRVTLTREGSFSVACRQHIARYSFQAATEGLLAACRSAVCNTESRAGDSRSEKRRLTT